jgi:acetyl-CoA carboxylase biotin carboxyl carrier protein
LKFQEILELIDKVAERGIASVEIEQSGTKLKIEGKSSQPQQVFHVSEMKSESSSSPSSSSSSSLPAMPELTKAEEKAKEEAESEAGLHIITSPIVGTFYRSPSPESPSFVNVGDRVSKGKVLCIIEAMKLMNEIESDIDGVITKIYPSNGQPVEYGEKLFAVKV